MPQLPNHKQTTIASHRNQRAFAQLQQLKQSAALEEKYALIPSACDALDAIAPEHLEDPDAVIEEILYCTAEAVVLVHKEEGRNKLVEPLIGSTIRKIVEIFGVRTKRAESLSFITKLLQKKGVLFYRTSARSPSVKHFYPSVESQPTNFHHESVALALAELLKYHKLVWEVQLKDLIDFAAFINALQSAPLCCEEGNELVEALAVELLAYFKSGRPELLRYCQSISSLKQLEELLLRKVDRHQLIRYISQLGPTLAETFLRAKEWEMRRAGLALMEHYLEDNYRRFRNKREEEWKKWVREHEIFEVVFSDFKFCEEMIDKHAAFFRCMRRYKTAQQRSVLLVGLLKQNMEGCNKFSSFICKELDCYYLDQKSKEILLQHLNTVTDYAAVPAFFETLQDIPSRDSEGLVEKVYLLLVRIMKEDYEQMGESQRSKCFAAFKYVFQDKYLPFFKSKSMELRQKILREAMMDLLTDISTAKITLFNFTIIEHDMWKTFSNNPFHTLLTQVVEECHFFERVFAFLESRAVGKSKERDFVKIIKFITNKVVSKQDAIFKYIHIISSFHDIFEEMIESSGFAQIEELMKKVVQLFRDKPHTPFHILTLTFQRINYQSYSESKKLPSLLQRNKEQKQLTRQPKELKFFEAISELMLETDHQPLRSQIAAFLLSLYTNYAHANLYSSYQSGQETFITFITELAETFCADYTEFLNTPSLSKVVLVGLQLLEKALQFTDVLGCGEYRPHKSLVSTSTTLLSVANSVTFGEDVPSSLQRDFPSSATLFDALTLIGLAFKCGPESIVLRQGERFISPILNSTSLEDLHLTQEQIVAELNSANALQTPQLFESKGSDFRASDRLRPEIVKIIGDVFNRFAFEGKMSLIQCTSFVRRASGADCLSSDRRVQEVFDCDADRDGIVTLSDFIEYYRKNLSGPSYWREQMLKGLFNLRYRKNLTLYNEPLDISSQYYLMMRFKIAKNYHHIYQHLFALANHPLQELSSKAQHLLLLLPSWPKLHSQSRGRLDFKLNSEFEIYYKLIAIEHQLSVCCREERQARVQQFVANSNNQLIFMLLTEYHNKHHKSEFEQKSLLICLRILRSLVNVEDLSSTSTFDSPAVPALPQTTYFAENTLLAYRSRNMINFETLLVLQLSQKQADVHSAVEWCFESEEQVRRIACNFLYLWSCKNSHFADLFRVPIPQHNNQQWFELLCAVIKQGHVVEVQSLRDKAICVLQEREESFEQHYDPLMNGYLKLLSAIASRQSFPSLEVEKVLQQLLSRSFSEKNRALIFELISGQRREIGYAYFQRMLSTILPSQECLIRQRFVGIKNLGAICYINSILQQFFMIEQFRHMMLSKAVPTEAQRVEVGGRVVVDHFMYQLQKLYHHLHHGKKKYVVPRDFCFSFKNFEGQPINTSIQEDAHEFLNRLIESAEEGFKKEGRVGEFEELLSIRKLSEIECEVCKHRIDKIENDYCLTLQVKDHGSLAESLRKFTEREEITGYFCQQCQREVKRIFKRTYLNQLPQVLILNLQRIIYDQSKGEKAKVHSQLTFPHSIDFADYIKNDSPVDSAYRLKGVVIHTGTSEGGHYYSLIRTKQFGWLKFNDQSVTPFEEKDIQRESFGGFQGGDGWGEVTYSTNAYILFYQQADLKEKEYIEVENEFSSEVQAENGKLVNELQVHQESFFNAIIFNYQRVRPQNLDHLIATAPFLQQAPSASQQQEFKWLIRIVQKAFSFLGVYTEIKGDIRGRISSILRELYFMLPQQTMSYFKDCNVGTYFQNMISDSSSGERQTLKDTFLHLLLIHIHYRHIDLADRTEEHAYLFDILDRALSYSQSTLFYANVTKAYSYLEFWQLLLQHHKNASHYLLHNHYFFRLIDMLSGKESPFMKQHPFAQDLPKNLVPCLYASIDSLLKFKLNLKGKKVHETSFFPTSSLEAHILTSSQFYRRLLRLQYDHDSLSHLITHYSSDDLEFSAVIADFLVSFLSDRELIRDVPLFFKHVADYLKIKDGLQRVRMGWVVGVPQNKEIDGRDQYCLSYSDRSDCIRYISGINYKRGFTSFDNRKPMLEVFSEKKLQDQLANVFIVKTLLEVALQSETAFEYLLGLPPLNYHMKCTFDSWPEFIGNAAKDNDLIFEKKLEVFEQMRKMLEIAKKKVESVKDILPVQKYIIGKTKQAAAVAKSNDKDLEFTLKKLCTYVLENRPLGGENESMPRKYFSSQNPVGIANAFINHRSKHNYESQAKEVTTMNTLYVLSGKARSRLTLIFKGKLFRYHIVLAEGEFSFVFPFEKEAEIDELVDILPAGQEKVEVAVEDVERMFGVKEEQGMQQQKVGNNAGLPAVEGAGFTEPKIKCSICTFDNQLTRDHCEMCDNPLFN